uniref:Uncharacterized protein n=1 Tax=Rhizophora mucronata TaxID=61149 RepID=A0A2P2R3S5_RHIMU
MYIVGLLLSWEPVISYSQKIQFISIWWSHMLLWQYSRFIGFNSP